MAVVHDLHVFPIDVGVVADRLQDRFFGCKATGEMMALIFVPSGIFDFLVTKNVAEKMVPPPLQRFFDALDFDDVGANT